MVKRKITKYGGSVCIKLEVADVVDNKLNVGDFVNIQIGITQEELMKKVEDAVFEKLKKENLLTWLSFERNINVYNQKEEMIKWREMILNILKIRRY